MPDVLRILCQRAPALSHTLVFLVTLFGPTHASPLYYTMYVALHTMMLVATCQVFWGTLAAVMGTRKQEQGSWRREWASKKLRDVESDGERDFLPGDVEHVIIIPNYNEEIQVLMETLDCLASHPASRYQYRVILAMEAREDGSESKANYLLKHYAQHFKAIVSIRHPDRIQGESKGKASNVNWGAREAAASSSSTLRARQIITVMDSDILIAADYFEAAAIRFVQANAEERKRMMFVLPLVFDRNADQVPRGVRVTDVTWATAGMSSIYPGSMIKIPTSAYSVTMDLATRIGFWDVGPEGIGEDFHMFCKSFLSTGGQLISHTIYSPASVTNVVGAYHGQGFRGWHMDLHARYQRAVRHLWGSLDTGYVLRR